MTTMGTLSRRNRKISFTPLSAGYGRAVRRFGLGAELHRAYVRRHTRQSTRLKSLRNTETYKAADPDTKKKQEEEVLAKCAAEYADDVDEVNHEWRVRQSERGRDVGFIEPLKLAPEWGVFYDESEEAAPNVVGGDGDGEATNFKLDLPPRPLPPGLKEHNNFDFLPAFPDRHAASEPDKMDVDDVRLSVPATDVLSGGTPQPSTAGSERRPRKKRAAKSATPAANKKQKKNKQPSAGSEWEQYTTVISAPQTPDPQHGGSSSPLSSAPGSPTTTESAFPELSPFTDTPSSHRRRGPKPSTTPGEDPTKNFVCTICQSRFKRREHLKRHMTTLHTADKPFVCGECGKKCSREDNLTQHFKTRHAGGNGNGSGNEGNGGEGDEMDFSEDDGGPGGGGGSDGEAVEAHPRKGSRQGRKKPRSKKEVDWEKENWMAIDILREAAAAVAAQEMETPDAPKDGDGNKKADGSADPAEKGDVNGEKISFLDAAGGEPPLEMALNQENAETSNPKEMMVVLKYKNADGEEVENGADVSGNPINGDVAGKSADQMVSALDDTDGGVSRQAEQCVMSSHSTSNGTTISAVDSSRFREPTGNNVPLVRAPGTSTANINGGTAEGLWRGPHDVHGKTSFAPPRPLATGITTNGSPLLPDGGLSDGNHSAEPDEERRYKCHVIGCTNTYKNSNGLKYHKAHGHKNQQLRENPDGTATILNSETHSMEKVKPYQCEVCGKRYKNLNGLKYHRNHSSHSGATSRELPMVTLAPRPGNGSAFAGSLTPGAYAPATHYPRPTGAQWPHHMVEGSPDAREFGGSERTESQEPSSAGDPESAFFRHQTSMVPLRDETLDRSRRQDSTSLQTPKRVPPRRVFMSPKGSPEPFGSLDAFSSRTNYGGHGNRLLTNGDVTKTEGPTGMTMEELDVFAANVSVAQPFDLVANPVDRERHGAPAATPSGHCAQLPSLVQQYLSQSTKPSGKEMPTPPQSTSHALSDAVETAMVEMDVTGPRPNSVNPASNPDRDVHQREVTRTATAPQTHHLAGISALLAADKQAVDTMATAVPAKSTSPTQQHPDIDDAFTETPFKGHDTLVDDQSMEEDADFEYETPERVDASLVPAKLSRVVVLKFTSPESKSALEKCINQPTSTMDTSSSESERASAEYDTSCSMVDGSDEKTSRRAQTASRRQRTSRGTFLPRETQTPGPEQSTPVQIPHMAHTTQNTPASPAGKKGKSKNLVNADLAVSDILESRTRGPKKKHVLQSSNSPSLKLDSVPVKSPVKLMPGQSSAGTKGFKKSVSSTVPQKDDLEQIISTIIKTPAFIASGLDLLRTMDPADLHAELMLPTRVLAGEKLHATSQLPDDKKETINSLAAIYCAWKLKKEIPVMELSTREIRELRRGAKEFDQWMARMAELLKPYEQPMKRKRGRPPGSGKKKRKVEGGDDKVKATADKANKDGVQSPAVSDGPDKQLLFQSERATKKTVARLPGEIVFQVPLTIIQVSLIRSFLDRMAEKGTSNTENTAKRMQVLANHPRAFVNQIRHRTHAANGARDPLDLDDVYISDSEQLTTSPKLANEALSSARRSARRRSSHFGSSQAGSEDELDSPRRPKRSQTKPANWAERLVTEKERFYPVDGNKFNIVTQLLKILNTETAVVSRSRETLDCLKLFLREHTDGTEVIYKNTDDADLLWTGLDGGKVDWGFEALVILEEGEVPESVLEFKRDGCRTYRLCTTTQGELDIDSSLRDSLGWDSSAEDDMDAEDDVARKVKEACACLK